MFIRYTRMNGSSPASGELDEQFPDQDATHQEVAQYVKESFGKIPNLLEVLSRVNAQVYLHGHNHLQYAVEIGGTLFLNPGSCGCPSISKGERLHLLRYESGSFNVEERRVPYQVERVLEQTLRSPQYAEAAGWYQLNSWELRRARDCSRVFFRFLRENQERACPRTDQENNQVFHRLFLVHGSIMSAGHPVSGEP